MEEAQLKPQKAKKQKKDDGKDSNNYWRQLERLDKLNKSSEVKATVIFSFHSLIIGLMADRIDYFRMILADNYLMQVPVFLWFVAVLISVFYCFRVFRPQIIKEKYDDNVFFFGDAVSKFGDIEGYIENVNRVVKDKPTLYRQLAQQLHVESTIITTKFKNVQKGIQFFGLSIALIIVSVVGLILIQ